MTWSVKEMFYTLQGEGGQAGRAAVFCRFAGCNLWSGREADRATAVCRFCDTEFVGTDGPGGGKFASPEALATAVRDCWPHEIPAEGAVPGGQRPLVVCTGGEPLLQLDAACVEALHQAGFEVAIETNGTLPVPEGVDWVCVSPKAGAQLVVEQGNELKLVYPQAGAEPHLYEDLDFTHRFLQPMDGPRQAEHVQQTVDYCLAHPAWRLSLQTHKLVGLP